MIYTLFKNKIRFLFLLILFGLIFLPNRILAQNAQIILTEISAHPQDANCEYFVIYNISNADIDLTNTLTASDNLSTDTIKKSTKFNAKSGMILSPQDYGLVLDDDCTNIDLQIANFDKSKLLILTAGSTIGNGLANTADNIDLKLNAINQDSFKWTQDYGIGKVFKKLNLTTDSSNNNWSIDGISLSNYSNTSTQISNAQSQISNNSSYTISATSSAVTINSQDVIISEIYPSPDSKLAEKEWIEIYNASPNTIDLTNFYLQDLSGSKYKLSGNILANSYLQFFPTVSLNNSGDTIFLYYNSSLIDKVSYSETLAEESWIKSINSNLTLTCQLTPGSKNISKSCVSQTTTAKSTSSTKTNYISKNLSTSSNTIEIPSTSTISNATLNLDQIDMRNNTSELNPGDENLLNNTQEVLGESTKLAEDSDSSSQILAIPILGVVITTVILIIRKLKNDRITK